MTELDPCPFCGGKADWDEKNKAPQCTHCDPENYHCDHAMSTAAPLKRKPDDFCSYGERKEGAD